MPKTKKKHNKNVNRGGMAYHFILSNPDGGFAFFNRYSKKKDEDEAVVPTPENVDDLDLPSNSDAIFDQSDISAGDSSTADAGNSGEGGGLGEDLDLNEERIFVAKNSINDYVELPDEIRLLEQNQVNSFLTDLDPLETAYVGYITPLYFYKKLWDQVSVIKLTELYGDTGYDYNVATAGADSGYHDGIRGAIAKKQEADPKAFTRGHDDNQYSADYDVTNRVVQQHRTADNKFTHDNKLDDKDKGKVFGTILWYPDTKLPPRVQYFMDVKDGTGYHKVSRDYLKNTLFKKVEQVMSKLDQKTRDKIEKVLGEERISDVNGTNIENSYNGITVHGQNFEKNNVRALYTNQVYYVASEKYSLGHSLLGVDPLPNIKSRNKEKSLDEDLELNEKRETKRYYIRPQHIFCANKNDVLKALIEVGKENCSVYTLKNLDDHDDVQKLTNNDIIYYYDEEVLYDKNHVKVMDYDLFIKHEEERPKFKGGENAMSKSDYKAEYDDRMTKETIVEDLKAAYDHRDEFLGKRDTSWRADLETSTNLEDINWLLQLGDVDVEVFNQYADGAGLEDFAQYIYDQNSSKFDDKKSDEDFWCEDFGKLDEFGKPLSEADNNEVCCICGEEIHGYGNNAEPYAHGRCCDACNIKFVIPSRLNSVKNNEEE